MPKHSGEKEKRVNVLHYLGICLKTCWFSNIPRSRAYESCSAIVSKTKHSKTKTEARSTQISNHCRMKDYNFKSCMTQAKPGGGNGCVKAWKWPRIVVPSSFHESAKGWTFGHVYFWLIVFQINHVSLTRLTSADCYHCHSLYCLARVFQNLPAPHKHYGVFDIFADFQSFFQPENLGFALSNVHRWQISTSR